MGWQAWGVVLLIGGTCASVQAEQDVYTCVDAHGHRYTEDRPIAACVDREQQVLGSNGVVRRVVPPNLTYQEQVQVEEQQRRKNLELARQAEERNRERALFARYPNPSAVEKDRNDQLEVVDGVILAAKTRIAELVSQGKSFAEEMQFYAKDPSKAPPQLRAKYQDNLKQQLAQKKFIADQAEEKRRVNQHFDQLTLKLKPHWEGKGWSVPASAPAMAPQS